jgi:hypothetical protein
MYLLSYEEHLHFENTLMSPGSQEGTRIEKQDGDAARKGRWSSGSPIEK